MRKINFLKEFFNQKRKGVASLITILSLSSIIFIIIFTTAIIFFWQFMKIRNNFYALNSYYSAYSGIQDALLKLERNIDFSGSYYLSVLNNNDVSINLINNDNSALITSTSSYFNNFKKIQLEALINTETGKITINSFKEVSY